MDQDVRKGREIKKMKKNKQVDKGETKHETRERTLI
jgi:hypothetical protein